MAFAKNTAYIGAEFETSIAENTIVNGNLKVLAQGSDAVEANVRTAVITASLVSAGANIGRADLSATQYAALTVGGKLDVKGNVDVQSLVGRENSADTARAIARIGANGAKNGVKISIADAAISKAVARENMSSSAIVRGGAYDTEKQIAKADFGRFVVKVLTEPDYEFVESITYTKVMPDRQTMTITSSLSDEEVMKWLFEEYNYHNYRPNSTRPIRTDFVQVYRLRSDVENLLRQMRNASDLTVDALEVWRNYNKEIFAAIVSYKDKVKIDDNWLGVNWNDGLKDILTAIQVLRQATDEDLKGISYRFAFMRIEDQNLDVFKWDETRNYGTKEVEKLVWEESWKDVEVNVPLYDRDKNFLYANNLNVYSGIVDANGQKGQTLAQARTDGGNQVGFLSLGGLDASAYGSDSFSTMLEGMHAIVTGNAALKAESNTNNESVGFKSGTYALANAVVTNTKAQVGSKTDPQSVSVIIGEGAELMARRIDIDANNYGSMQARMESGLDVSVLGNVSSSKQPTEAWYSTLVSIGRNAKVETTNGPLNIRTTDLPSAVSDVVSKSIGIGINFNTMKGENQIHQENNLDIGAGVSVIAKGDLTLSVLQNTHAHAVTENSGGGFISGNEAQSANTITRVARINVGDGAQVIGDIYQTKTGYGIQYWGHRVDIQVVTGDDDIIYTRAYTGSAGFAAVSKVRANAVVTSNTEILLGQGVIVRGIKGVTMEAKSVSHNGNGNPGVDTSAAVDALGLVAVPNASARSTLEFNTYIGINRYDKDLGNTQRTIIDAGGSSILSDDINKAFIRATTEGLVVRNNALAAGKGGIGVSNATAWTVNNLQNAIWIDNTDLRGADVYLYADNGNGNNRTRVIGVSHAALKGLAGKVAPTARISGQQVNQIRTTDAGKVKMEATGYYKLNGLKRQSYSGTLKHEAASPGTGVDAQLRATYDRSEIKVFGITITLTKASVTKALEWYILDRCDFCGTGQEVDVLPSHQDESMEDRYEAAYKRAINPLNAVRSATRAIAIDDSAVMAMKLAKGLIPLTYLDTLVSRPGVVFRSRHGIENTTNMTRLYVLDQEAILTSDVRLDQEDLKRYQIWTNNVTQYQVYMLPNASRIDVGVGTEYISDTLTAEDENGNAFDMDVICALTRHAVFNPVIPVGSGGSLDFQNGILTIPAQTDMELFLDEISASWLVNNLDSGYFRACKTDALRNENPALFTRALPKGEKEEKLTFGEEINGVMLYWIGKTPDETTEPDDDLLFLLVNERTDEVRICRISIDMMTRGEDPVDVNLFVYRDRRSERMEQVRYNVIFFDTHEGEKSKVQFVTNVLPPYTTEIPRELRVSLRSFTVDGADASAYRMSGHLFVLADCTDGEASLFDDFYTAVFDGDTFESNYIRVENIKSGECTVTVKQGQPVWIEKLDERHAVDLNGTTYELLDGAWQSETAKAR